MSNLKVKGEETVWGELIQTPEHFIEDICNRINNVYETALEEEDEMQKIAYLIGSIIGLKGRLDRVCQNE